MFQNFEYRYKAIALATKIWIRPWATHPLHLPLNDSSSKKYIGLLGHALETLAAAHQRADGWEVVKGEHRHSIERCTTIKAFSQKRGFQRSHKHYRLVLLLSAIAAGRSLSIALHQITYGLVS